MDRAAGDSRRGGGARRTTRRIVKILVGASLFAAVVLVTVREWREVSDTLVEIGPVAVLAALALTLLGLSASAMTWRQSLLELGDDVTTPVAHKVYLLGQLGKYIPGSVWAFVLQMELARSAGVRRARALGAGVVAAGINVLTGSALGLALQPFVGGGSAWRYVAAVVGVLACALVLAPPVLSRLANLALRVARQRPLDRAPSWNGTLRAVLWSVASWLLYGVALGVVAIGAGANPSTTLLLCLPAVALAMTIGFLVAVSPSGIGIREAVLVVALAPVLEPESALGVALVLRLVFTFADLIAAAATVPIRITSASTSTSTSAETQTAAAISRAR